MPQVSFQLGSSPPSTSSYAMPATPSLASSTRRRLLADVAAPRPRRMHMHRTRPEDVCCISQMDPAPRPLPECAVSLPVRFMPGGPPPDSSLARVCGYYFLIPLHPTPTKQPRRLGCYTLRYQSCGVELEGPSSPHACATQTHNAFTFLHFWVHSTDNTTTTVCTLSTQLITSIYIYSSFTPYFNVLTTNVNVTRFGFSTTVRPQAQPE